MADVKSGENVSESKIIAAYLPFPTLLSAIDSLRMHGLPSKIDRTAWSNRSGADQTQILSAFKFLGFLDETGRTQDSLKAVVQAVKESGEERAALKEILLARYKRVFEHDLTTATPGQLQAAIETYNATGATRGRAVRFFLKAAHYAQIPLSSRFKGSVPSTRTSAVSNAKHNAQKAKRKRKADEVMADGERQIAASEQSSAMRTITLPKAGGILSIGGTFNFFALHGAERDLVYQIIDKVDEFEKTLLSTRITHGERKG